MQRYNFQFTGQRFFRIRARAARRAGARRGLPVEHAAGSGPAWPRSAVPSTYLLGGALNCGKAQPGQVAPVSHGCPVAVFDGVNVLNTAQEARA